MPRVVWILGAGFSKPLGGPLLTELLSPGSTDALQAAFRSHSWTKASDVMAAVDLYRAHLSDGRSSPEKPLWRDAEEFLSFVDAAGGGSQVHRERLRLTKFDLERFGKPAFPSLAATARRLIAAECSAFLADVDPAKSEHWGPYLRWSRGLGPNDTVITFNYDLVPELLGAAGAKLAILDPSGESPSSDSALVLKVHGSVNWVRNGPTAVPLPVDAKGAYLDVDHERVIATPGPTKAETVRELKDVWAAAERAIKEATMVVFIGYRFPPSDAESRHRILMAITQNESPYLSIHTVLGPRPTDDSTRLAWLLGQAVRRGGRAEFAPTAEAQRPDDVRSGYKHFNVVPHPAWAEDFLDTASVGHLMQPWRFLPGGRGI